MAEPIRNGSNLTNVATFATFALSRRWALILGRKDRSWRRLLPFNEFPLPAQLFPCQRLRRPTAPRRNLPADEAKTDQPHALVESYQTWLFHEYHSLCDELSPEGMYRRGDWTYCNNAGDQFHWVGYGEKPKPLPSTRAAAVLAAVGCDWREDENDPA